MRAVRLHGVGELRVEEVPLPGPPPAGYLRLKVAAAGICGSDLHNYRTGMWISHLPVTPGHEFAATVAELGADVEGFRPGDLVVTDSRANCGSCVHCLEGNGNLCLRWAMSARSPTAASPRRRCWPLIACCRCRRA
jgi:(R,R)-butanediol dehydrogenase/meso-butanediol dehydrogenase/diacetyl reductase